MPLFIDIHTHQLTAEENGLRIHNLAVNQPGFCADEYFRIYHTERFFSAGLHPWFLQRELVGKGMEVLENLLENQQILMVGECGLDRIVSIDFEFQKEVFIRQILLAEKLQKPLIIHCVRAFPELIAIKKRLNVKVPMIVHGFNNNLQICEQLVKNQFYISLGAALLNPGSNASKAVCTVPLNQLFLETDDKNCTISSIFAVTSEYLGLSIEDLQEAIAQNFRKITEI